jgi:PST family polysaccharide transporter
MTIATSADKNKLSVNTELIMKTAGAGASVRRTLTSTALIGGSSIAVIFVGLIRSKILAILTGPDGIGVVGIYQTMISTATSLIMFGSPPLIAAEVSRVTNQADEKRLAEFVRSVVPVLFAAITLVIALIFLSSMLWQKMLPLSYRTVGWTTILSVACIFSALGAFLTAISQGRGHMSQIATTNILSAAVGSSLGIAIVAAYGQHYAPAPLLFTYVFGLLAYCWFNRTIVGTVLTVGTNGIGDKAMLRRIYSVGAVLTVYSVLEQLSFLILRWRISSSVGIGQVGLFQAAWSVAIVYLGIVTNAMSTDFLPRIAARNNETNEFSSLLNSQVLIGLLIGSPLIVAMIGFSDIILRVLYTNDFVAVNQTLKLLFVSDIIKLITWPLGIALLGIGNSEVFLKQGPVQLLVLMGTAVLFLPHLGLISISAGVLMSQVLSLTWGYHYARRKLQFNLSNRVKRTAAMSLAAVILSYVTSVANQGLGYIVATSIVIALTFRNIRELKFISKEN